MNMPAELQAVIDLASPDEEGAPCSEAVLAALTAAIERRRGPDAPPPPVFGPLVVRRDGLPDWWGRDNLLLAAPGVRPALAAGLMPGRRLCNVGVVGEEANVGHLVFAGVGGLIVVGDRVDMRMGNVAAGKGGTILIGEGSTARPWARVDARNGGAVLIGADGMWAERVNILTDDMHAIRTLDDGKRANCYGGRIVLERHVWLCEDVRVTGGAHIGADSVIGLAAAVRGALPAGSVCVGSPAKPVRLGVTWTREDLP